MFNSLLTKQNVFVCAEMYRTNVRPNPPEYYKSLLISVKQKLPSVFGDIIKTWQDHWGRLCSTGHRVRAYTEVLGKLLRIFQDLLSFENHVLAFSNQLN